MWYLSDIVLISLAVVGAIGVGLYFLNRRGNKKMAQQQTIIDQNKMIQSIFIIDKRKDKIENVNMPKAVIEQMPKLLKFRKLYFIKAKIGPQIMTLMCDKKVYNALPVKKNIKVELVGMYIMGIPGQKTGDGKKTADTKKADEKTGFVAKLTGKKAK